MKTPLIFDIKRSTTADGPGVRTAIFFKGCNLDCYWCHNPESKSAEREKAFFKEKCVSCGACRKICENDATPHTVLGNATGFCAELGVDTELDIVTEKHTDPNTVCERDAKSCTVCGKCASVCPAGAIKMYGRKYTPDEIFEIIKLDEPYFKVTGGGVTLSGGECMLYPDFVTEIAKRCHACQISVAVDTAGAVPFSSFKKVLPYVDLFLYDIKCIDPELHKKGTGRDNSLILENLDKLLKASVRVKIRVPLIPGFNDGDELEKIKSFCENRGLSYELLPYHDYGENKKIALICAKM